MKKYRVTVNGTVYEVEVEALTDAPTKSAAPADGEGGQKVTAPMPGTILSVKVQEGERVQKGQVLMSLEAMKMENEIMAPKDGVVVSVHTEKGASVEAGTLLCVIR